MLPKIEIEDVDMAGDSTDNFEKEREVDDDVAEKSFENIEKEHETKSDIRMLVEWVEYVSKVERTYMAVKDRVRDLIWEMAYPKPSAAKGKSEEPVMKKIEV
jgi:hypothetical protein